MQDDDEELAVLLLRREALTVAITALECVEVSYSIIAVKTPIPPDSRVS
jgi:hypothetical protein